MAERKILDFIFRNLSCKIVPKILPLVIAPEVVEKDEAAAHDVLA